MGNMASAFIKQDSIKESNITDELAVTEEASLNLKQFKKSKHKPSRKTISRDKLPKPTRRQK